MQTEFSDAARADVDTYLSVAASLATGKSEPGGSDPRRVEAIVAAVEKASGDGQLQLLGSEVKFDYSMMKPRGHYTKSEELSRYFRAMSWLGRVEAQMASRVRGEWRLNRQALEATLLLRNLVS